MNARVPTVGVVWFDPGITTGVCLIEINRRWVGGEGKTTWQALGRAIEYFEHIQIGRHARNSEKDIASIAQRLPTITQNEIRQVWQMQDYLDDHPNAAWGYEDFVLRAFNQSPEFLSPVRLFNMLTYSELTTASDARVPFVQSASTAKSTATDARLQAAGLYAPGMPHATDAARHAATFLRRARADEALRKVAWPKSF